MSGTGDAGGSAPGGGAGAAAGGCGAAGLRWDCLLCSPPSSGTGRGL